MLSTKGLTTAQQQAILSQISLANATGNLTTSQMTSALITETRNEADAKALLLNAGLISSETAEATATNTVTAAKLRELVQTQVLTQAEADLLATKAGIIVANEKEAVSFARLGTSAKNLGNSLLAVGKAHPVLAAITIAIGAIASIITYAEKKNEEFIESQKELIEELDESISKYDNEISSLDSLQKKLQDAKGDKEALASIQGELNKAIGDTPDLLNTESNAYSVANQKIDDRIKRLKELRKLELEDKVTAQKEIFNNSLVDNAMGIDHKFDYFSNHGLSVGYMTGYDSQPFTSYVDKEFEFGATVGEVFKNLKKNSYGKDKDKSNAEIWKELIDSYGGAILDVEEIQSFFDNQTEYAQKILSDYINNSESIFTKEELNKIIANLVEGGYAQDLEGIENVVTSLVENNELEDTINNYYESLYNDDVDSEALYRNIKVQFDTLINKYPELKDILENFFNNIGKDINASTNNVQVEKTLSFIDTLNSADYAEIKDELLELAKSGEITPEVFSSTEEYANLLKSTDTSAESAMNQILDLLTAQEKLAGFSQGLDKLKSAYEEFKDEDIGFVTAETLQSLPDAFKKLPEFDLFSQIVGDPTSGAGAIQQAFNDIVKAYMLSQDVLQGLVNASEHDIQSYIANFKQMGVTNAEEVVNIAIQALNSENELLNSAEEEYINYLNNKEGYDADYLKSVASKNSQLASALGEAYKADYDNWCDLLEKKSELYNEFIKRIGNSYNPEYSVVGNMSANGQNMSASNIAEMSAMQSQIYQAQYEADRLKDQLKVNLAPINTDFGTHYSPSSSKGSSGSKDSNKPSEVTQEFNWIEKYLESFARRTEKIMNRISDYLSFKKNISTIKSAIKSVRSELSANEQALAEYAKQMNAIGLDAKYIEKIKNGALEIETIIGYETDGNKDANAQLIEKIEKYQDLYDKYTDIEDTIEDLRETEKEWLVKNLEYVNEYYQKLSDIKNLAIDTKQDDIDLKEAQGERVTSGDYNSLISNNDAYIKSLKKNYKKTNAEFNKLVKNGTIEKESAEWFEWTETLADLNSEIVKAQINTAEWKDEINQIKINNYTSSLDRLEAKYDKLNTSISRKESSNIVVTQSDYNKVIKNLDQQITKNNKLLTLYKQLQPQTEKNSEKWREYQELIEQTESTVESLRDSIIETAQKIADIIAELRDLKLEDNENASNLLSAKYDNATTASERNKILDEQDALAKSNLEINNQAYKDYTDQAKNLGKQLSQYISNATKDTSEAKSLINDTSSDLVKERENYSSYVSSYEKAQEKYSKAKTKAEKSSAETEMKKWSVMMDESTQKIKALEATLVSYNTGLEENQSILSQLDDYEFGKEIDLSKITDEEILKVAAQYNETLKQQKQALIDAGLSEQEAIKVLRENASQRIQNILDEAEALDVLNQAMKNQIKSKMDLNKTQGYTISDTEYKNYIGEVSEGIKLYEEKYKEALEQFNKNLQSGVYKDNEELYLKDKANIEALKTSIYDAYAENESMLDEILQLRIDALTEEKEAIQKLYDLQQRRYKLEEAQYNLEKAKQRTNIVYNGDEFIYKADTDELKDAEKALQEAKYNELINKIDDWIQAMEDAKEDFNLYDADGNPLGSTEDIINAAMKFGDDLLDGLEKIFKLNNLEYSDGELKQIQTFADGGVVGKSQDSKFDAIAKSLEEDKLVAVKDGEMILTKAQGDELYKKLVGTAPVPVVNVKPVIPDNLVKVNTTPNISVDMSGMQFNQVQNMDQFTREIQKMAQKASSMIDMELGKRKM